MEEDTPLMLGFPDICGKKVEGDFAGGNVTSDGGVLFLRMVEKEIKIIERLTKCIPELRDERYVDHAVEEMLRQRVFQIACGYEDANDCNTLRKDPAFKTACGQSPESGSDLSSQPTMSRLENAVSRTMCYRIAESFVDGFISSYSRPPETIILDVDDTEDETHGAQQLSLFNGYYDEYCYEPLHIYEGKSGKLITSILRPGKRPDGKTIVSILKRIVARIRQSWPEVEIILRGDSHFSAPEVHEWCEEKDIYYVLGQTGNARLNNLGSSLLERAKELYDEKKEKVRLFQSFSYKADSWIKPSRIVQKAEVTSEGTNSRFVVTNFESSQASFIYDEIYCERGQMENYIKNHKTYLHSDRTSCHAFIANQFRLFLHSAAYVLLHRLQEIGLRGLELARTQFDTIQKKLLKVGARVRELVTKIKFHFPTSFPLKEVFSRIVLNFSTASP